jgi:hypothetical protein
LGQTTPFSRGSTGEAVEEEAGLASPSPENGLSQLRQPHELHEACVAKQGQRLLLHVECPPPVLTFRHLTQNIFFKQMIT